QSVVIGDVNPNSITSTINIVDQGSLESLTVDLNLTHTYIGDLTISLTSPSGTTINLLSEVCDDSQNINATFEDGAGGISCGINPAISGIVSPSNSFAIFEDENINGAWVLTVNDGYDQDGGSL